MNRRRMTRLLVAGVIVVTGMLLVLYPFISNYTYEHQQEQVIFRYDQQMENTGDEKIEAMKDEARKYNKTLAQSAVVLTDPFDAEKLKEQTQDYMEMLNPYGDGIMGYIEIPEISVYLPVYHTTEPDVLEQGVGHLENTSLPIGGESTHAVISGHTGLSDKRLFTDLEILEKGDIFYMHVLDETLAYKTDKIEVVEPEDTKDLRITQGEDYLTLVTCTPYGVNSHRLLVRGTRVPYVPKEKKETPRVQERRTSRWMRQYVYAISTGLGAVAVLILIYKLLRRAKRLKRMRSK